MIVKYVERYLKYFNALFADIFNHKEKKDALFATEGLAVTSCMTSAQQFALNFGQNSPNSFQTGCANFCGPKTTVGNNDLQG